MKSPCVSSLAVLGLSKSDDLINGELIVTVGALVYLHLGLPKPGKSG